MILVHESTLCSALIASVILGVISLASIRLQLRNRQACQFLFFAALAAVGGVTMLCLECHHGGWLLSAVTLGAMVVGATFDAGSVGRSSAFSPSDWIPPA